MPPISAPKARTIAIPASITMTSPGTEREPYAAN
jgi:hypothetical protein